MHKRWIVVAVAVGVAFGCTGLAMAATGSSRSDQMRTTLHVIEHPVNEHVVDLPPKGDSQGDLFPFSNLLFNASNTSQVGRDQGNCIRTNPARGEWQCSWTNKLADGQITVEGPFYDTKDSVIAITGGTGAYASATGDMQLVSKNGGAEYDFIFNLR